MTQIVADTDVVSFLFKNHPIGIRYEPEVAGRVNLISFIGNAVPLDRAAVALAAPVFETVYRGAFQSGLVPQVG